MHIPQDLSFSRVGFDSVIGQLKEFDTELIRRMLLLYTRYQQLNEQLALYATALEKYEDMPDSDPRREKLEAYLDTVIDTFNNGLDQALKASQKMIPVLVSIAKHKEEAQPMPDYDALVNRHLSERQERLDALDRLRRSRE